MATDQKEPWADDSAPSVRGIPLPVIKLILGVVSIVLIAEFVNYSKNLHDLLFGIGISIFTFLTERLAIKATKNMKFSGSVEFLSALPMIVAAIAIIVAALTYGITGNGIATFGTLIFPTILILLNWLMSSSPA